MKSFLFFLLMLSPLINPVLSQNNLFEKAKNNPSDGYKLCKKFKEFNLEKKTSAASDEVTKLVSDEITYLWLTQEIILYTSWVFIVLRFSKK